MSTPQRVADHAASEAVNEEGERYAPDASGAEWKGFLKLLNEHEPGLTENIKSRVPLDIITFNSDCIAKARSGMQMRAARIAQWEEVTSDYELQMTSEFFEAELCFAVATTPDLTPDQAFDALDAQYRRLSEFVSGSVPAASLFTLIHQLRRDLFETCVTHMTLSLREADKVVRNIWLAGLPKHIGGSTATKLEDDMEADGATPFVVPAFQRKYARVETLLQAGDFEGAARSFALIVNRMVATWPQKK